MTTAALLLMLPLLNACGETQPEAIKVNRDNCAYCKMTIADARFATQLVTEKGRVYKFDDISCMERYIEEARPDKHKLFVADFEYPVKFIEIDNAFMIAGDKISSPMGGNIAAFSNKTAASRFALQIDGEAVQWRTPADSEK